ncbi:MAG: hypothetical protein RIC36_04760 [Rhodospirillales bacterium]
MITFNPATGNFQRVSAARPFEPIVRSITEDYASALVSTNSLYSPSDFTASASTVGMDLCHHLSFGDIEQMIVDYLNGVLSVNQFLVLVGAIFRPSWANLFYPPTLLKLTVQWALSIGRRLHLIHRHHYGTPAQTAVAANQLVHVLNNTVANLRYGHRSTNRSIQGHFDLRLQRGANIDPLMLVTLFYGWYVGRPVFSAESSALLNDWEAYARTGIPALPGGGLKLSESSTAVALTGSGNPVMGTAAMPVREPYRRTLGIPAPVSVDSLLLILGAIFIAWWFGFMTLPFLRDDFSR